MDLDAAKSNSRMVNIEEVQSTARSQRVAAHSHVKGLGLHPESKEALPKGAGFIGQEDAREAAGDIGRIRELRRVASDMSDGVYCDDDLLSTLTRGLGVMSVVQQSNKDTIRASILALNSELSLRMDYDSERGGIAVRNLLYGLMESSLAAFSLLTGVEMALRADMRTLVQRWQIESSDHFNAQTDDGLLSLIPLAFECIQRVLAGEWKIQAIRVSLQVLAKRLGIMRDNEKDMEGHRGLAYSYVECLHLTLSNLVEREEQQRVQNRQQARETDEQPAVETNNGDEQAGEAATDATLDEAPLAMSNDDDEEEEALAIQEEAIGERDRRESTVDLSTDDDEWEKDDWGTGMKLEEGEAMSETGAVYTPSESSGLFGPFVKEEWNVKDEVKQEPPSAPSSQQEVVPPFDAPSANQQDGVDAGPAATVDGATLAADDGAASNDEVVAPPSGGPDPVPLLHCTLCQFWTRQVRMHIHHLKNTHQTTAEKEGIFYKCSCGHFARSLNHFNFLNIACDEKQVKIVKEEEAEAAIDYMPSAKRAATTRDASGITTKRVRSEKKTNSAKGAPKKNPTRAASLKRKTWDE